MDETASKARIITAEEREARDVDFHLRIARMWAAEPFKQYLESGPVIRDGVMIVENLIGIVETLRAVISLKVGSAPVSANSAATRPMSPAQKSISHSENSSRINQELVEALNTTDYRNGPSGIGPQAATWQDKPHRLVYDLCREIDAMRAALAHADAQTPKEK